MPAKDAYHEVVKHALVKDGWIITHDPLRLQWGSKDLYVDLGAEQLLAADKAGQRIAVEIKSFLGASPVTDLERALGQFVLYQTILTRTEPERVLYLAIREAVFLDLFEEPLGQLLLAEARIRLLVFNPDAEEICRWIPS
jgi:hypothetical protein